MRDERTLHVSSSCAEDIANGPRVLVAVSSRCDRRFGIASRSMFSRKDNAMKRTLILGAPCVATMLTVLSGCAMEGEDGPTSKNQERLFIKSTAIWGSPQIPVCWETA